MQRSTHLAVLWLLVALPCSLAYFGGQVLKIGCSDTPEIALPSHRPANPTWVVGMRQTMLWQSELDLTLLVTQPDSMRLYAVDVHSPNVTHSLGIFVNLTESPKTLTKGFNHNTLVYSTPDKRLVVINLPTVFPHDADKPLIPMRSSPAIPASPELDISWVQSFPKTTNQMDATVLASIGKDVVKWDVFADTEPLTVLFRHPEDSVILSFGSQSPQHLIVLDSNKCLFFVDTNAPPVHRVSCLYMSIDYQFLPQLMLSTETAMAFAFEKKTSSMLSFSLADSSLAVVGVYTLTHSMPSVDHWAMTAGKILLSDELGESPLIVKTCRMSFEQMLLDLGIEIAAPTTEQDLKNYVTQIAANVQNTSAQVVPIHSCHTQVVPLHPLVVSQVLPSQISAAEAQRPGQLVSWTAVFMVSLWILWVRSAHGP